MQYEENKTSLLATLPQIRKNSPPSMERSGEEEEQKAESRKQNGTDKKGVLGECVPNPTNGNATIYYEVFVKDTAEIQIYNAIGQLVKSVVQETSVGKHQANISVAGLPVGVYHYTLIVNGERVNSKKLVVN
jgi:hypothetical protein